jgi:Ethanolamine utilization protein EutJ (predicted chaperonin)
MFRLADRNEALKLLGGVISERGEAYEVVVIGGAGLQMLGVIDRPTRDLDLLALLDGVELVEITGALPEGLQRAITDSRESWGWTTTG